MRARVRRLLGSGRLCVPACLGLVALWCTPVPAQHARTLVGEWMLDLQNEPANLEGLLVIETADDGLAGYVEGGPIDITLSDDGAGIELRVDARDTGGRGFERILTGEIRVGRDGADVLQGTWVSTGVNESDLPPLPWRATRYVAPEPALLEPAPVDLSGIWNRGSGVDMRKHSMDTTPAAEARTRDYDPSIDQPPLRCLSPGIVQLFGYVYPVEIIHARDRIFIINEAYAQVRQIYLDGRQAPDYYPHSRLGFSVGHWEGSTLVVNTSKIRHNIRDFKGEPISDNATVEERYRLSEDGQFLHATMVVHDPQNYHRSPIRRIRRARDDDAIMLPYECDPDSFFRELYTGGRMDEYWSRIDQRP